jgi:hypothetical protein
MLPVDFRNAGGASFFGTAILKETHLLLQAILYINMRFAAADKIFYFQIKMVPGQCKITGTSYGNISLVGNDVRRPLLKGHHLTNVPLRRLRVF